MPMMSLALEKSMMSSSSSPHSSSVIARTIFQIFETFMSSSTRRCRIGDYPGGNPLTAGGGGLMLRAMRASLTRIAIWLIALNAAVAILVLLTGEMGETGGRILLTSVLATITALLGVALMPAVADRRLGGVAIVAVGAAVVGFVVVALGIWTDAESDLGWRLAGTAYAVAVGGAIAALLAGLPIRGRAAWVGTATVGVVGLTTVLVVVAIWGGFEGEAWGRLFAILAVLVAAGGLAVPILHRSTRDEGDESPISHCPYCATGLGAVPPEHVTCPKCGRRFSVSLEGDPNAQN